MTQTIREQLQALVEQFRGRMLSADIADVRCIFDKFDLQRLESILATPEPAVTVRKGWIAKDSAGIWWYSDKPFWDTSCEWWNNNGAIPKLLQGAITDPWETSHPNGGPECCVEVG